MFDSGHNIALRRPVRAQFVGDHVLWRQALLLEQSGQQPFGCLRITAGLNDFVENITILIDGTPQSVFSAANGDHHLVQMPDIVAGHLLSAQLPGIGRAELPALSPDRFTGDDDTTLQEHFLDKPQAQRKPEVQPHGVGNDRRWKTVVLVADD